MVVGVGNVEVAGGIQGDADGGVERCAGGRSAIAGETGESVTGDDGENPVRRHARHQVAIRVGQIDVSSRVDGNSYGRSQGRRGGGNAGNGKDRIGSEIGR